MHFLLFDSLRELVNRVDAITQVSMDQGPTSPAYRMMHICYQVLEKTNRCIENIYYKHILQPKLQVAFYEEQLTHIVAAAVIHMLVKKKGQTINVRRDLAPLL